MDIIISAMWLIHFIITIIAFSLVFMISTGLSIIILNFPFLNLKPCAEHYDNPTPTFANIYHTKKHKIYRVRNKDVQRASCTSSRTGTRSSQFKIESTGTSVRPTTKNYKEHT